MQDGAPHAARRLGLPEGPVHGVQQAQGLHRAVFQVAPVALKRHATANVHVPQVHGRVTINNPIGQHFAGATGRLDADRVKASGHKQVTHLRRLAQQVAVVGREAFRTVEKQVDAGLGQGWRPVHGSSQQRLNVLQVIGQLVKTEALGDAFHAPGLGHGLKPAHQQLARVFFEIRAAIGVAQHWQVGRQALHGLGHDVEMLGRMQGHGGTGPGTQFMGPHAGAVDHRVSAQHALCRAHADGTAVFHQNLLDLGVLKNTCATALGSFGQGLGGVDRVGAAVLGQKHAADQVAGMHTRPELADLARGEGLHFQPKALGH